MMTQPQLRSCTHFVEFVCHGFSRTCIDIGRRIAIEAGLERVLLNSRALVLVEVFIFRILPQVLGRPVQSDRALANDQR